MTLLPGTAAKHDVSCSQVYSWVKKYDADGGEGLADKRGHLEITRAAYYKWLHRAVPDEELENIKLAGLIREYDERIHRIMKNRESIQL